MSRTEHARPPKGKPHYHFCPACGKSVRCERARCLFLAYSGACTHCGGIEERAEDFKTRNLARSRRSQRTA